MPSQWMEVSRLCLDRELPSSPRSMCGQKTKYERHKTIYIFTDYNLAVITVSLTVRN